MLKSESKITLSFFFVVFISLNLIACTSDKPPTIEKLEIEEEIYTNKSSEINYEIVNSDDVDYNLDIVAEHGKIDNETYIAPDFATTDTITLMGK